jgi:hypothetical protein
LEKEQIFIEYFFTDGQVLVRDKQSKEEKGNSELWSVVVDKLQEFKMEG